MVSDELVLFQNGEKLDGAKMKDIDSHKGPLWDEVTSEDILCLVVYELIRNIPGSSAR